MKQPDPQQIRSWRGCTDEKFLDDCRLEVFRASGPGGQKRNKTSSAVRRVHQPTGLTATSSESRSQASNRAAALRRLRHRVVLDLRTSVESLPDDFTLALSKRDPRYLPALGLVLDILAHHDFSISDAAQTLALNTARLVAFLEADEPAWDHVNQHRERRKLRALRPQS